MSDTRNELVIAALRRVYALTDYSDNLEKQFEFQRQIILADESFTMDEKYLGEIYTADWISEYYNKWNNKEQQLKNLK
ncbi:kinase-like domain-containing protein [Rhizophagus clarus]|uniref:Kinase-like domain-containing protein n=1 Tax=Rhizophagus clarus TaxID=94130 RepID=A0A8H3QV88_9GLOM|nr:kinase-like domain-containing protein [Rhizophagus clarus]